MSDLARPFDAHVGMHAREEKKQTFDALIVGLHLVLAVARNLANGGDVV
jgi:hypothetical protein